MSTVPRPGAAASGPRSDRPITPEQRPPSDAGRPEVGSGAGHLDGTAPTGGDARGPIPHDAPRVGDYRLLSKIGEGGMGVVHLAQKPGGQRVALKVLRPHIVGDEEARHRLAREVNSLSRIRSPRVAEILDADPWAEIPFVATRYVPGLSLHDHVKQEGAVAGADLTHFAVELAAALDAVHRVGVLHRDIKPSNVLMEGRSPILIDFGLARVAEDPKLTHTGWLLGTPGYLAPEILYGDPATPAADIHALAATIAYAGLGRAPFGRGPAMAVMDRVRRGQHDLTGLPDGLRRVLEAALDPEVARRPTLSQFRSWVDPASMADVTRAAVPLIAPQPQPDELVSPFASTASLPAQQADSPVTLRAPDSSEEARQSYPGPAAPIPSAREPYRQPPPRPSTPPEQQWAGQPQSQPQSQPPYRSGPAPAAAGWGPPPPWGPPTRRTVVERISAGIFLFALGAVVASFAVLAPWITMGVTSLVVLGLWAYTLSDGAADVRAVRGRPPRGAASRAVLMPWYVVLALLGTLALVLWAVILALSAALLAVAVSATTGVVLAVGGAIFAVALYTGPGSSRVRRPIGQFITLVVDRAGLWILFVVLLAVLAVGTTLVADQQGTHWYPASGAPSAPDSLGDFWRNLTSFF